MANVTICDNPDCEYEFRTKRCCGAGHDICEGCMIIVKKKFYCPICLKEAEISLR